jgi:hypothetical protein
MDDHFPSMVPLRQIFPKPHPLNIPAKIEEEFVSHRIPGNIPPGSRIAVAVGSRGISNLAEIVAEVVKNLKGCGARPFIIPAMGSHGGATPEGQAGILSDYGITEKTMGVPVEASMDVDRLGQVDPNIPVYFSRAALQADGIVVVNRVKPHTDFEGSLGSGVLKMLAIGLAKRTGASACHFVAARLGHEYVIRAVSRFLLGRVPFLIGVAILENHFHQTEDVIFVKREEVEAVEERLLVRARELMPKLPFNEIDLLIVDRIGKNISGAGMDPNVIGRGVQGYSASLVQSPAAFPKVQRIVVCNLTPETHGNGIGIGMADFVTTRMVRALDHRSTYINALTAVTPQTAKIPIFFDTDRENIDLALASLCLEEPAKARVLHISDTLALECVEASEAFLDESKGRTDLQILGQPRQLQFDSSGNLRPLKAPKP